MAEICRLWGLGAGSEELIANVVLLRRPGAGSKKGTGVAIEKRSTGERVRERSVEKRTEKSPEEVKAKELEAQRAMKAKLKAFLENYELIPKVCIPSSIFPPHPNAVRRFSGTHFHQSRDAHHPSE